MRTLGDPLRLRLLQELPGEEAAEISVGELADRLGVAGAVVSQHLRVLSSRGLVGARRQGREARYFVNAAALRAARELLAGGLPSLFAPTSEPARLSARNQLFGKVVEIRRGEVATEIGIDIGGQVVTGVITNSSVERLGLELGTVAAAVFKATDVMVLR
ncbi:MAG: metalloregulator ArsR/SmtB family transcription factor [Candidatus Dormibacteraceae bacterium]